MITRANRASEKVVLITAMALFACPALAHVQLDAPNGGEELEVGSVFTVTWHILISHNQLNWDLWYSTESSVGPWTTIAENLPPGSFSVGSVHTYDWTIPDAVDDSVWVRVRMDNAGTDYYDVSNAPFSIIPPPCSWDLDGSGDVGIIDFLNLLANWGNPYDINDFLDLLANWGPCSFFVDCNGNGVWDSLDVQDGTSPDCNGNGVPDECDIADGTSRDVDGDGVPDECPPPNDDCENAQMINAGATPFNTIGATTDGLPQACDGGAEVFFDNDIWFRWTAECTGEATFSTCNDADFDTRIAVYFDGPCTPINAIACSDNADGCGLTSELTLVVADFITYLVRVGSPSPDENGTGTLTISCEPFGQP